MDGRKERAKTLQDFTKADWESIVRTMKLKGNEVVYAISRGAAKKGEPVGCDYGSGHRYVKQGKLLIPVRVIKEYLESL